MGARAHFQCPTCGEHNFEERETQSGGLSWRQMDKWDEGVRRTSNNLTDAYVSRLGSQSAIMSWRCSVRWLSGRLDGDQVAYLFQSLAEKEDEPDGHEDLFHSFWLSTWTQMNLLAANYKFNTN
jgi:hypothetical protein